MDARTDIFSLGAVLYEMIAGRPPFAGATPSDVLAAILKDEPSPLAECAPEAPPELERIVSKALRKDRAQRYQVARDLLTDLRELQQQIELKAKLDKAPLGDPLAAGTPSATGKRLAIFAAAALSIVAVLG